MLPNAELNIVLYNTIKTNKGSLMIENNDTHHVNIHSVKLGDNCVEIYFEPVWYQEDIKSLQQVIFLSLDNVRIQEKISGADRENIRFVWQEQHYFILNFDCYSQSCWLEGQDEQSSDYLSSAFTVLKQGV